MIEPPHLPATLPMESPPPERPDTRLAEEHFPEASCLEDIINDLKLREDILKAIAEGKREWEETDHYQVRLESIERLRENILSYIHPSLAGFAAKAGWLSSNAYEFLITLHTHMHGSSSRRIIPSTRRARRFAELHQRILDLWDRDMA